MIILVYLFFKTDGVSFTKSNIIQDIIIILWINSNQISLCIIKSLWTPFSDIINLHSPCNNIPSTTRHNYYYCTRYQVY